MVDCGQPLHNSDVDSETVSSLETESIDTIAVAATAENATNNLANEPTTLDLAPESATEVITEVVSAMPQQGEAGLPEQSTTESIIVGELGGELVEAEAEKKAFAAFAKKKQAKAKKNKPSKKPVAKMTPRQRRRRWLIATLQPMKSLKRPLTKLSSYQQFMLGRGRRSQLVKTELQYDRQCLYRWLAIRLLPINISLPNGLDRLPNKLLNILCWLSRKPTPSTTSKKSPLSDCWRTP